MKLPDALRTPVLLLILAAIFACVTNACAETTAPIQPCEYVARWTDSRTGPTTVVGYKELPCWDASLGRVVRGR